MPCERRVDGVQAQLRALLPPGRDASGHYGMAGVLTYLAKPTSIIDTQA